MRVTYDLYAETNPAFISFLLYRFVKTFAETSTQSPHFSLAYLIVPMALSERLEPSFSATNSATGLLAWLNRFPEVRIGLQQDVGLSKDVTAQGLRAALHSQLLVLGADGTLALGNAGKPPENTKGKLSSVPKNAVTRAERLAKWMSNVGGPATIFSVLEVRP